MGTAEQLRALDDVLDVVAYFEPEIVAPVREAVLLIKDLIEAGVADPAAEVREIRAHVRDDWRAALAAKFPNGG